MGNARTLFVSNLFMAKFEMKMKEAETLPKTLYRYVDDIVAMIERKKEIKLRTIVHYPSWMYY